MGRTVVVPDHPHRVICLMPSVTDTVFALGAGDDVVGISDYTKYPAAALKKPSVGDLIKPSIETILSLHPDLVIGVQPKGPMEVTDQLERAGIPIFLVSPHGIAGILHSVETIGQALNRTQQADALVHSLQQRVDAVKARTKGQPAPRVFMPVWYDPITTIGKNAFITEIIEAAGGRSVTDDLPTEWPQISMEVVLERAPEALLLVRGGKTTLQVLAEPAGLEQHDGRSRSTALTTWTTGSICRARSRSMHWRISQNNFILELSRSACNHPPTARCREARCESATTP